MTPVAEHTLPTWALTAAMPRLAAVLADSAVLRLLVLDADGIILWANRALRDARREQQDSLIGQPLTGLLTVADAERMQARLRDGVPPGDASFLINVAQGDQVPQSRRCWLLPLEQQRFLLVAEPLLETEKTMQDDLFELYNQMHLLSREHVRKGRELTRAVAELGKSRTELLRYQNELELLVHERTAELEVARDAAEAASRAKSTFLATISHELRTPLNAIIGQSHLLRRGVTAPAQQQQLDSMLVASQHLLKMINGIIDFSRLDAGRFLLEPVPFVLRELLDRLCAELGPAAAAKGLSISVEPDRELPPVLVGDAARLLQVLQAFLANAVKFTEQGGIVIRTRLVRREGEQVRVCCSVADTGIGISAEQQGQLFRQVFEQGDGSASRRFGGMGLGLTLADRIARAMDGEVGVSSSPGQGSTFWVELPLRVARAGEYPLQQEEAGAAGEHETPEAPQQTPVEEAAAPLMAWPQLRDRLGALRELLLADDLLSSRLYTDLQPSLEAVAGHQARRLGELIGSFALDEALELLDRILAEQEHE